MKKTWKWFYLRDVGSCSAAAAWTAVACDWPRRIPCANWKQWTRWTGKTTGGVNEPWKSIFKKGGGFLRKEKKKVSTALDHNWNLIEKRKEKRKNYRNRKRIKDNSFKLLFDQTNRLFPLNRIPGLPDHKFEKWSIRNSSCCSILRLLWNEESALRLCSKIITEKLSLRPRKSKRRNVNELLMGWWDISEFWSHLKEVDSIPIGKCIIISVILSNEKSLKVY